MLVGTVGKHYSRLAHLPNADKPQGLVDERDVFPFCTESRQQEPNRDVRDIDG